MYWDKNDVEGWPVSPFAFIYSFANNNIEDDNLLWSDVNFEYIVSFGDDDPDIISGLEWELGEFQKLSLEDAKKGLIIDILSRR